MGEFDRPKPGDTILLRFPKPHPPQKQDEHTYPAMVIRVYDGKLSCVVFVDFLANVPRSPGGTHVQSGMPVHVCMDCVPFNRHDPEKGGWSWPS